MIISKTPVRVSFLGGGTDYPDYYLEQGGAVLGSTIDKYVYLSVNRLSPFFDYRFRVAYSKLELVDAIEKIQHPSVKGCLKFKDVSERLDIHTFADLPARTGLGSSSAFTVGLLNALARLEGKTATKQELANDAIFVEQKVIGENVGSQDQVHAAYGGFNIIQFDSKGFRVTPVAISDDKKRYLEQSLMVIYTGQTRFASEVLVEQMENLRARSKDDYLARMKAMVFEAAQVMNQNSKEDMVTKLGDLMHEGWELKKELSQKIATPLVNEIYAKACAAGAYGGKLLGAGGGGFLAFLVAPDRKAAVRAAIPGLLEVQFCFENEGSTIIHTTR